jgi:hypothetical protein
MSKIKPNPLILITGGTTIDGTDDSVIDVAGTKTAAALLGAALAENGFRIAVFSPSPAYIEGDVVAGYLTVARPGRGKVSIAGIEVHAPISNFEEFPGQSDNPGLFVSVADQHSNWRRSFLRTLASADGVLLIAGGRSTSATGYTALSTKIPLLAIGAYGGAAREVWQSIRVDFDLPNEAELSLMGKRINSKADAVACVKSLSSQISRQKLAREHEAEEEAKRTHRLTARSALGVLLLGCAILIGCVSTILTVPDKWASVALYLMGALGGSAAALSGSSILDSPPRTIGHTLALGMFAGLLSEVFFVVAQISAKNLALNPGTTWLGLIAGALAGFGAEKEVRNWAAGKVKRTSAKI